MEKFDELLITQVGLHDELLNGGKEIKGFFSLKAPL